MSTLSAMRPAPPPETAAGAAVDDDEDRAPPEPASSQTSASLPSGTLEGTLLYRAFRTKRLRQSTRVCAVFDLAERRGVDFGRLRCYRLAGLSKRERAAAYGKVSSCKRGDKLLPEPMLWDSQMSTLRSELETTKGSLELSIDGEIDAKRKLESNKWSTKERDAIAREIARLKKSLQVFIG